MSHITQQCTLVFIQYFLVRVRSSSQTLTFETYLELSDFFTTFFGELDLKFEIIYFLSLCTLIRVRIINHPSLIVKMSCKSYTKLLTFRIFHYTERLKYDPCWPLPSRWWYHWRRKIMWWRGTAAIIQCRLTESTYVRLHIILLIPFSPVDIFEVCLYFEFYLRPRHTNVKETTCDASGKNNSIRIISLFIRARHFMSTLINRSNLLNFFCQWSIIIHFPVVDKVTGSFCYNFTSFLYLLFMLDVLLRGPS